MKLITIIMAAIAVTGFLTIGRAFNASHAIYVQAKVLKSERVATESMAKADTLSRFADQTFVLFGVAGGIQIVRAIIGSAIYRTSHGKRNMNNPGPSIVDLCASRRDCPSSLSAGDKSSELWHTINIKMNERKRLCQSLPDFMES
jgi:hypothetical protein